MAACWSSRLAQKLFLDCVDEQLEPLDRTRGVSLIESALTERASLGIDVAALQAIGDRIRALSPSLEIVSERRLFKDEILDRMASTANVAQFVSFSPGTHPVQRFCRIRGFPPNHLFASPSDAVRASCRNPPRAGSIFGLSRLRPEGNPLDKLLARPEDVIAHLQRRGGLEGLYTIVNETINEGDGGVSGVAYRSVIEFAPDANPRCVDDENVQTAALPLELGMRLLGCVYGFEPDLRGRDGARVEFSIHPAPRGWMHDHTVIWQVEQRPERELTATIEWPNRFSPPSRRQGIWLALAASAGLPVPRSLVVSRRLLPFLFGTSTGTGQYWTRTCPAEKMPGNYPSARGWFDPMKVLEDWSVLPSGHEVSIHASPSDIPTIASVLVQEAVTATYSGRALGRDGLDLNIAGVRGEGDAFMLGDAGETDLPHLVRDAVRDTWRAATDALGPVSFEWVFDGFQAWIVQASPQPSSRIAAETTAPLEWVQFRHANGRLEEFRQLVKSLSGSTRGIIVSGNVSPLSHLGEIAELHHVPVRFVRSID